MLRCGDPAGFSPAGGVDDADGAAVWSLMVLVGIELHVIYHIPKWVVRRRFLGPKSESFATKSVFLRCLSNFLKVFFTVAYYITV